MKVRCMVCDTDDIPETWAMEYEVVALDGQHLTEVPMGRLDTTARDHLRIWHPDEWMSVELVDGVAVLQPTESVGNSSKHPDTNGSDPTEQSDESSTP